jgi:predicted nucleic acid-binding protein
MYLDTSVIVKLFVREPDSEFYGKLADGATVSSSALAWTEVWSALLGKERAGVINAPERDRAWAAFERAVAGQTIEMHPLTEVIFTRANRILSACHPKVPLRSLDALHLAACDQAQDWPLATGDFRMREAARLLNFPVTPLPE